MPWGLTRPIDGDPKDPISAAVRVLSQNARLATFNGPFWPLSSAKKRRYRPMSYAAAVAVIVAWRVPSIHNWKELPLEVKTTRFQAESMMLGARVDGDSHGSVPRSASPRRPSSPISRSRSSALLLLVCRRDRSASLDPEGVKMSHKTE